MSGFDLTRSVSEMLTRPFPPRSVILACEYEPYSVLERLLPSIGGSAPVIVYSPYLPVRLLSYSRPFAARLT